MTTKAFTLVELLVSIAVVALLAAIALPVFFHARASARASVCLSNLHQFGLALHLYAQDFDGAWPTTATWSNRRIGYGLESASSCPDAALTPDSGERLGYAGYVYNKLITVGARDGLTRDADLAIPAMTIAVMDGPLAVGGTRYLTTSCPQFDCRFQASDPRSEYPETMEKSWERHHGGANYLLCDGHARWYEVGQVDPSGRGDQGKVPSFSLTHAGDGRILGVDP